MIRAIKVLAFLFLGTILALLPTVVVAQLFLGSWIAAVIAIPTTHECRAWAEGLAPNRRLVAVLASVALCFSCAVALALQAVGGGS